MKAPIFLKSTFGALEGSAGNFRWRMTEAEARNGSGTVFEVWGRRGFISTQENRGRKPLGIFREAAHPLFGPSEHLGLACDGLCMKRSSGTHANVKKNFQDC